MFGFHKQKATNRALSEDTPTETAAVVHTMNDDLHAPSMEGHVPPARKAQQTSSMPSPTRVTTSEDIGSPFFADAATTSALEKEEKKSREEDSSPDADISGAPLLTSEDLMAAEEVSATPPKRNFFGALFIVVTGVAVVVGGYYIWTTRTSPATPPPSISQNPPAEEPSDNAVTAPDMKFSDMMPNILTIDPEQAKKVEVTTLLTQTAADVLLQKTTLPIEFLVKDTQNNAVDFSIFALLFGLSLPQDVLQTLNGNFSLYVHADDTNGARVRLGVAVAIKDQVKASAALRKNESKLPTALAPFFLGITPEIQKATFANGTHGSHTIRYANLDAKETLSVDYTLTETHLVIGTTKQAMRAILDKIDAEKKSSDSMTQ